MQLINKNQNTGLKKSLVLAGGGMRVAYQAGVLLALEEAGIQFTHVDGTSGGIFNAAMLASGQGATEITERWRTLKISDFVSGRKFKEYFKPLFMEGYADADNIRNKVFPHLGIDPHTISQNEEVNATFNVCNFSKKSIEAIGNRDVGEDHLIAGVSLPIFMPALKVGTDWYTDAVWIKDANLMEGVNQGSQELWLVWAIGNTSTYFPGAFNQYVHMIEMSANGALLEEYKLISMINKDIATGSGEIIQKEAIKLFVVKSQDPLPLDPDLFFNKINTRELINWGYENAKNYLQQELVPEKMDQNATKSTDPGSVLSFRATFKGKSLWDAKETKVIYYTYFRFSLRDEIQFLSCLSSIYIAALGQEIPAYDHQISRTYKEGCTLLETNAKIQIKGEEHYLNSSLKLFSSADTIMGIGLKKIYLTIGKASSNLESFLLQGQLHQSVSDRLKACYFTRVKNEDGTNGGLGKRYKMISKLIKKEAGHSDFPPDPQAEEKGISDSNKKNTQE